MTKIYFKQTIYILILSLKYIIRNVRLFNIMSIYVITHKIFEKKFNDDNYCILHVGKNKNYENDYFRDNYGENISDKNYSFCELTGLYWIWKNINDDIVGLCHYRRYFCTNIQEFLYNKFDILPNVLSGKEIVDKLKEYDIILPKRIHMLTNVYSFYASSHNAKDMDVVRQVISEKTPKYLECFDNVMKSKYYYYANMFICKKEYLDDYCEWLFEILFEVERRIDISQYDDYQKRIFGFLSERLLQVWVIKNNLNIKEYPVFNTEAKKISRMQIFNRRFRKCMSMLKNYKYL